jgi:N-acetylmuramoyl-L-alanine amidase
MSLSQIALCVGHSRKIDGRTEGGAVSHDGKSNEWHYNLPLAIRIRLYLREHGIRASIISEYQGKGYSAAQRWLAGHLATLGVRLALELHVNSAGPTATGHEWLHWHSSTRGRAFAGHLDHAFRDAFPTLKARGLKPKTPADRGAEFLRLTHCPAVIGEPGFGSNAGDWQLLANQEAVARAYTAGIVAMVRG